MAVRWGGRTFRGHCAERIACLSVGLCGGGGGRLALQAAAAARGDLKRTARGARVRTQDRARPRVIHRGHVESSRERCGEGVRADDAAEIEETEAAKAVRYEAAAEGEEIVDEALRSRTRIQYKCSSNRILEAKEPFRDCF